MIKETPAVVLRQNLGELLNEVQYRQDSVVITRDGKPVAALIDMQLFEKIRSFRQEFELMVADMRRAYQDVNSQAALKEIDEAVTAVRGQKRLRKKQ